MLLENRYKDQNMILPFFVWNIFFFLEFIKDIKPTIQLLLFLREIQLFIYFLKK